MSLSEEVRADAIRSPEDTPLGSGVRARFPSLRDAGDTVFFDNAAGAQVPAARMKTVERAINSGPAQILFIFSGRNNGRPGAGAASLKGPVPYRR